MSETSAYSSQAHYLQFNDVFFDPSFAEVFDEEKIATQMLTFKEAKILEFFFKNAGKIIHRDILFQMVWRGVRVSSRTVDTHISRLRKKIEQFGISIDACYGSGYQLKKID